MDRHPMERSAAWTVLLERGLFEGLTGDTDRELTTEFLAAYHAAGSTDMWAFAETWSPVRKESPVRKAVVRRGKAGPTVEQIEAYLPANYVVVWQTPEVVRIEGEDFAGWTLDGYVIPRLASGLISAQEVTR